MLEFISALFVIIGSIIGAGFASGKEISIFFCPLANNFVYLIFFTFVNFIILLLILYLREKYNDVNTMSRTLLFGRKKCLNNIAACACFLFCASMFSSLVNLFSASFLGLIISIIVCFIFVYKGSEGIKLLNLVAVPLLLGFILFVSFKNFNSNIDYIINFNINPGNVAKLVFYSSINLLLAMGSVFSFKSKTKLNKVALAFVSSIIISSLIFLLSNALFFIDNKTAFPILYFIKGNGFFEAIFSVVLWLGIITTFCGCVLSILNLIKIKKESKLNKSLAILSIILVSSVLSLFGLDNLIEYGYFVIGFFSLLYFIIIILSASRKSFFKKGNTKVHKTSKNAQDYCTCHNKV